MSFGLPRGASLTHFLFCFCPPCCLRLEDHTEQRAPCICAYPEVRIAKISRKTSPSAATMFVERLKFKISAGHRIRNTLTIPELVEKACRQYHRVAK